MHIIIQPIIRNILPGELLLYNNAILFLNIRNQIALTYLGV